MSKPLTLVPAFLALVSISAASFAQQGDREITTQQFGKLWGLAGALKDTSPVFYLDPENIPADQTLEYIEGMVISALKEFNNSENPSLENTTLSMTYGGLRPGACSEPFKDFPQVYPSQHVLIDPDINLFCFSNQITTGGIGDVTITYDENGKKHESLVTVTLSEDIGIENTYWLDNPALFKNHLLHELGHMAGLGHVPPEWLIHHGWEGRSVMCTGPCGSPNGELQPFDIDLLQFLYSTEPEQNPGYPRHCMGNIMDRSQEGGAWGEFHFDYVLYQGVAYRLRTNLNPETLRFELSSYATPTVYPEGDCTGLELVNGEIFIPHITLEHYVYELLLQLTEDSDGIYLQIVDGSRIYPSESDEELAARREESAAMPRINFQIETGVSPDTEQSITDAALGTEEFFGSLGFPEFNSLRTLQVYASYDSLLEAFAATVDIDVTAADLQWQSGSRVSALGWSNQNVFINVSSSGWAALDEANRTVTIALELFTSLQFQQRRGALYDAADLVPSGGPVWLREGSKNLIAYKSADWQEKLSFGSILEQSINSLGNATYNLADMETQNGYSSQGGNQDRLGLVASNFLSQDLIKYIEFYTAVGDRMSWQDAFTQTFGKTPETFYEEFAAYQSNGYQS